MIHAVTVGKLQVDRQVDRMMGYLHQLMDNSVSVSSGDAGIPHNRKMPFWELQKYFAVQEMSGTPRQFNQRLV